MAARRCCNVLAGLTLCGALSPAVAGEADPHGGDASAPASSSRGDTELWEALSRHLPAQRPSAPDWIRRRSKGTAEPRAALSDDWQMVLQQDRADGADLLTVRYPLAEVGLFSTYAGAGLNRTTYYAETDYGATIVSRHYRARSLGAAAELGAELRLSDQLAMSAELRWFELASDAGLLRSGESLIGADPLALAISLGWRFR